VFCYQYSIEDIVLLLQTVSSLSLLTS